jgi:hypothetical protein
MTTQHDAPVEPAAVAAALAGMALTRVAAALLVRRRSSREERA